MLWKNNPISSVLDHSCLFNKTLVSIHHELDDLFRDEVTYFKIITKPRLYNFSTVGILFSKFMVQNMSYHEKSLVEFLYSEGHALG